MPLGETEGAGGVGNLGNGDCSLVPAAVVSSVASHPRGDGDADLVAGTEPALAGAGSPRGRSPSRGRGSSRGYGSVVRNRERGTEILKPSQCQRLH